MFQPTTIEEVIRIDEMSWQIVRQRSDFEKLIEAPLLEAVQLLYDKNIGTIAASANVKDVGEGGCIVINYNTLSEENRRIAEALVDEGVAYWSALSEVKVVHWVVPIHHRLMPVKLVREKALELARRFKLQPFTWVRRYTLDDLTLEFRLRDKPCPAFFEARGYFYDQKEGLFYLSKEQYMKAKGTQIMN